MSIHQTASDLCLEMARLRSVKPSKLTKMYGPNPTEFQIELHAGITREWNAAYRLATKRYKAALEASQPRQ